MQFFITSWLKIGISDDDLQVMWQNDQYRYSFTIPHSPRSLGYHLDRKNNDWNPQTQTKWYGPCKLFWSSRYNDCPLDQIGVGS